MCVLLSTAAPPTLNSHWDSTKSSSCSILILLVFAFDQSDCQTPASQRKEVIKSNVAGSTVTATILTWQLTQCPTGITMFTLKTVNIIQHPRDFTLAPSGWHAAQFGNHDLPKPAINKYSPWALCTWFHQMLITTHESSTIIIHFYRWETDIQRLEDLPKITRQSWDSHSGPRGARAHALHLPKPITARRCGFKSRLCSSLVVWLLANFSVSLAFESTSAVCLHISGSYHSNRQSLWQGIGYTKRGSSTNSNKPSLERKGKVGAEEREGKRKDLPSADPRARLSGPWRHPGTWDQAPLACNSSQVASGICIACSWQC